jgi:hypothetical protein
MIFGSLLCARVASEHSTTSATRVEIRIVFINLWASLCRVGQGVIYSLQERAPGRVAHPATGVKQNLTLCRMPTSKLEKERKPLQLRNEAQLNCVSLRSQLDCEVTGGGTVGRPSCQSSLLSDPNPKVSAELWRNPQRTRKVRRAATSALTFMIPVRSDCQLLQNPDYTYRPLSHGFFFEKLRYSLTGSELLRNLFANCLSNGFQTHSCPLGSPVAKRTA